MATTLKSSKTKTPNREKHVLEQSSKKNKLAKLLPNCNRGVALHAEFEDKMQMFPNKWYIQCS